MLHPVQFPNSPFVLARPQVIKHPLQLGPYGTVATKSMVNKGPFAPRLLQGVHLKLDILVRRADTCISDTGWQSPLSQGLIKG